MQSLRNTASLKRISGFILLAGMGVFAFDAVLVIFSVGFNFQWGWLTVRSTTLEFPVIAFLCSGLLLLIVRGQQKEVLLLISALILTLFVVEGILRIMDHPLSRPYVDFANWYEPSNVFGHQLVPQFEGFGPLKVPVKINSHGFRDTEHSWDIEQGTIRILGLGDSFLFGWGVTQEETFLKQLENLLGHATNRAVETINAGVPGWGLNQYYLYLKTSGVRYSPNIVVLEYFTDDLNAAILEAIPASEQYREGLKYKGGALHRSRLYNFAKSLSDQIRDKNRATRIDYLHSLDARRAEWAKRENYLMTKDVEPNGEQYERLLADYLSRIKQIAMDHGAVLVIVYIPDIAQIFHPEVQHINRVLARLTTTEGIPFVDMTPTFETSQDPVTYYLWPLDPHTNARGHMEMAKSLLKLLCEPAHHVNVSCNGPGQLAPGDR